MSSQARQSMMALAAAELAGDAERVQEIEKELPDIPRCKCGSKAVGRERDGKLWCYRCGVTRP